MSLRALWVVVASLFFANVGAAAPPLPNDADLGKLIAPALARQSNGRLAVVEVRGGGSDGRVWKSWAGESRHVETFVHARVTREFYGDPADGLRDWGLSLLSDVPRAGLERYVEGESLLLVGETSVGSGASFTHRVALRGGGGVGRYAANIERLLRDFTAASLELELSERQAQDIERVGPDCKKIATAFLKHADQDAQVVQRMSVLGSPNTEAARRYFRARYEQVQSKLEPMQECAEHPAIAPYLQKLRR